MSVRSGIGCGCWWCCDVVVRVRDVRVGKVRVGIRRVGGCGGYE